MLKGKQFEEYLAQKTNISLNIIEDKLKSSQDVFKVIDDLIVESNLDREEVGKICGGFLGYTYVNPMDSITNKSLMNKIGLDFITQNNCLPLYKMGKAVTIAMSDPDNPFLQDKIESKLQEIISIVFCFPSDIQNYLKEEKYNLEI